MTEQEAEARRLLPVVENVLRSYWAEREGMDEASAVALIVVDFDGLLREYKDLLAKAEQERDELYDQVLELHLQLKRLERK